ncbi:MAG: type II secretion system protein GspK [Planctomycetota bacterium]|nr:type II secretion system protein GspK [Planctomycetota bacterium]
MVIILLAAMVAASLLYRMRAETSAAGAADRGEQAYQSAMAGVQMALLALGQNSDVDLTYDSPDLFRNQLVYDDGANKWYFTVYAPRDASQEGGSGGSSSSSANEFLRSGLMDESAKINLLTADADALARLPNVTAEMAAALIAYRSPAPDNNAANSATQPASGAMGTDASGSSDSQGSGQDYYDSLPQPYLMPHGPLTSVDELLLVKGFTPAIVYGEDINLNGVLDPNENDSDATLPLDNGDGKLDTGLLGLTTIYSSDTDLDSTGKARININTVAATAAPGGAASPSESRSGTPLIDMAGIADSGANLSAPPNLAAVPLQPGAADGSAASPQAGNTFESIGLPAQTIRFIHLYTLEGNRFTHPSQLLEMQYTLKNDHNVGKNKKPAKPAGDDPNAPKDTAVDDTSSDAPTDPASGDKSADAASKESGKKGETITSGITAEFLPLVMDRLTTKPPGSRTQGLVNVNAASADVLAALPGIDANLAQRIADVRGSLDGATKSTTAWLVTQDNLLTAEQFKQVAPRLTSRSYQYRLRCVGFGWPCGRFRVIEAVIDASRASGKVLYLRDLTRLGLPLALDPEGSGSGSGTGK